MNEKPHIRVELLSDPTYLAGVRQLVAGVSQRLGISEEACSKVALAVDEALCNVICHGYDRNTNMPIWVSIWPLRDHEHSRIGIKIVIEDEARHVELCELKSRPLDKPRPGGLGVHIIREVMDSVCYEKRSPKGMRVTLEKYESTQSASMPQSDSCACQRQAQTPPRGE